jgi:hypothetical protein
MFDDEMMDAMIEETRDYYDEEFMQETAEFYEGDYDSDDYYEDWDNLEMGFDPYMGCYSDDC